MAARRTLLARLRSAPQAVAIGLAVVVVVIAAVASALLRPGSGGAAAPADDGKAISAAPRPTGSASPAVRTNPSPTPPTVPDSIQHQPETAGKNVNITIDDGPDPKWTPRILQVLRRHHVHATFCMIGPQARANPALVKQVVADGHRLCDHTVHHDTGMDKKTTAYQSSEILGALDMIEQASGGARVYYYRAPGGAFTPPSRALAAQHGMRPLGWNIDTKDFDRPGVSAILHTMKDEIHNGPTILFHDGGGNRGQTVQALDKALTWLRQQGYGFSFPKVD
ncbi:Peptidoglycan/xylan/chitin deacetylase, PgdA/CDA1 family [Streptomyces sp. DvalAA-14]|uniref:polysaccharide deacetylase family protein n=1 Tax=unclassified Streptomyces TaxID=2593676 RepID=UPI00081B1B00|nr:MULTISPECIES: polysaccharide deacetylase family protein [unclassified Streptomyces]MYS24559.1 polysaccharide deacetylase family protein [Streptomyces sp. SID4948]SCE47195.1 Peptidoglycan/xylan/chitin deacetylase, PgdA/CDA1 family [Streptomyces sp. DvalAA-14]